MWFFCLNTDIINYKATGNKDMNDIANTIQNQLMLESFIKNALKKGYDKELSQKCLHQIFSEKGVFLPPKNTTDLIFRRVFAHDSCYILLEGLKLLYSENENIEIKEIILKTDEGKNAHFLLELTFKDKNYYADAYGIFENISEIENRYTNTTIAERVYFDSDDENDPHYQDLRDLTCFTFDIAEDYMIDNNKESDTESVFDSLELALKTLALQSITPIGFEKECAPK